MKTTIAISRLIVVFSLCSGSIINAQPTLWFGTVKMQGKVIQGRFEVVGDGAIKSIIYAPYGIGPTTFREVKEQRDELTFVWEFNHSTYRCLLLKLDSTTFKGKCTCEINEPIELTMRKFSQADAYLQGDSLHAAPKDIQILDRALSLLNDGRNWDRSDNRVCDNSTYPYKWSLFCALHQASIDIDSEYRHLRPAIQAARQAINEFTAGKKYDHLLQDFNNEAQSFDLIAKVLDRAKAIINEKIKLRQ